jgi:recombination protein RecT
MAANNLPALKNALNAPSVKAKFEEMLGKRAPQFMTSITSVVNNNTLLQKADVNSIIMGAAIAASMDLPLNANLGYAALVPFNSKDGCFAQVQIMAKGWTELFLRSGQCQSIINEVVYDGQLVKKNKFTGEYVFDEDAKKSEKVIGFMAYFRLTNGFEKYDYMTIEEVKAHAQRFSQTFRKGSGIWKEHFEAMGCKTVLKRLLTKYAPKSIEMQQVAIFDQSVVQGSVENMNEASPVYVDNSTDSKVEDAKFEEVNEEIVDTTTGEVVEVESSPKAENKEDLDF